MIIRRLRDEDISDAVKLKCMCWNEDYAGIVPANFFDIEEEIKNITAWVNENCNDIRLLYGAYIDNNLAGFVGASIAETEDAINGAELNYLFVNKLFRGQKLGIKLFRTVALQFEKLNYDCFIVYNWHLANSNSFYHYLGGKVIKQVIQSPHGQDTLVDIFKFDMAKLCIKLHNLIQD